MSTTLVLHKGVAWTGAALRPQGGDCLRRYGIVTRASLSPIFSQPPRIAVGTQGLVRSSRSQFFMAALRRRSASVSQGLPGTRTFLQVVCVSVPNGVIAAVENSETFVLCVWVTGRARERCAGGSECVKTCTGVQRMPCTRVRVHHCPAFATSDPGSVYSYL